LARGGRYAHLYRLQMSTETENPLISANRDRAVPTEGTDYKTEVWSRTHPEVIIHLAARIGVSFDRSANERASVACALNLLEPCRQFRVNKFIFGSSSSVFSPTSHAPLFPKTKPSCGLSRPTPSPDWPREVGRTGTFGAQKAEPTPRGKIHDLPEEQPLLV